MTCGSVRPDHPRKVLCQRIHVDQPLAAGDRGIADFAHPASLRTYAGETPNRTAASFTVAIVGLVDGVLDCVRHGFEPPDLIYKGIGQVQQPQDEADGLSSALR